MAGLQLKSTAFGHYDRNHRYRGILISLPEEALILIPIEDGILTTQARTSEFRTYVIIDVSVSLCEANPLDDPKKKIGHGPMALPIEFELSGHFVGAARSEYGIPIWVDEPVG